MKCFIAAVLASLGLMSIDQVNFRANTDVVRVFASVRGGDGVLLPDLDRSQFEVRVDGRPVPFELFVKDVQPISVALVLDLSDSFTDRLPWMRRLASDFVDALHSRDRARIGGFGDEVWLSPHVTSDKSILRHVLDNELWPGGPTRLWEALDRSVASFVGAETRSAVLLISDGRASPLKSEAGFAADLRQRAQATNVSIWAIGSTSSGLGLLKGLAADTGGAIVELGVDVEARVEMIRLAEELRRCYIIGFRSPIADGRLHDLRVSVNVPGASVAARRRYMAPQ